MKHLDERECSKMALATRLFSYVGSDMNNAKGVEHSRYFLQRLESLRGLAALIVAFHHSFLFIRTDSRTLGVVQSIFYGHGAVLCFFVLSGLVLGLSLRRSSPLGASVLKGFYVRRLFRIYPAFVVSLMVCLLFIGRESSNNAATNWYASQYDGLPGFSMFISNLFFMDYRLNPVTWSLYPELIGSLMLPLLHFLSRNRTWRAVLFLALFLSQYFCDPEVNRFLSGLFYAWIFYLGYLLADVSDSIWKFLKASKVFTASILTIATLVCLGTPHFGHHRVPYVLAISCIIAVAYGVPGSKMFSLLDNKLSSFYGRISYSFYLFHFPGLYLLGTFMLNSFDAAFLTGHYLLMSSALAVASIVLVTAVSWFSYCVIEKPFIALGKAILSR